MGSMLIMCVHCSTEIRFWNFHFDRVRCHLFSNSPSYAVVWKELNFRFLVQVRKHDKSVTVKVQLLERVS